ncbi:MAG TPA: hypothetical protein VIM41_09420 [Gammaproteobacteria bacterium]
MTRSFKMFVRQASKLLPLCLAVCVVSQTYAWAGSEAGERGRNAPQRLDTSGTVGGSDAGPRIAMDDEGNAIAVWVQFDGLPQEYGLWANRYTERKGWGEPERINDYVGQASSPSVAMNKRGAAVVVWVEYPVFDPDNPSVSFYSALWMSRYAPGTGWQEPQLVDDEALPLFPIVALDDEGNAIVAYHRINAATDANVYARHLPADGSVGAATLLQQSDTALGTAHQLGMNSRGDAMVVWNEFDRDALTWKMWSNRFDPATAWSGPELIPGAEGGYIQTSGLGVDAHGNAMVAFTAMNADNYQQNAYASRYDVASGWEQPALLQAGTDFNADYLTLGMNSGGEVHVVWRELVDMWSYPFVYQMHSNRYRPGIGWGESLLIGESSSNFSGSTRIAVDKKGNAFAVWLQLNPDAQTDPYAYPPMNVYAYRFSDRRGQWNQGRNLQPGVNEAYLPDLAMDKKGKAMAVWSSMDTSTYETNAWAARLHKR